jgi:ferredoxin
MQITVNPISCAAHGLCAEVLPEWITLDEWGYPILDGNELPHPLIKHAHRAARACPTLAILLSRE